MDERLRLLILTHNYPRYDGDFAGVFLSLLTRRLLDHGIAPVVLAPHDDGAAEYEEKDGVVIHRFRYASRDTRENLAYRGDMQKRVLGSVSGVFRFKNFLNEFRRAATELLTREQFDVLAGHWLVPSGMVMKDLGTRPAIPMILSSHGTDIRVIGKYRGLPYRYLRGFTHRLRRWTVVSDFLRQRLLAMDPSLESKLEVLPLPHDETIFFKDPQVKREDNLVVSVTRFTNQKRVNYLVEAFDLVVKAVPGARLEIYGAGRGREEIAQLIARRGLEERIKIFEPVAQEKLRTVYNRASVVVLNSVEEGFGLTLSEAMLCGTAAIGARSGGITDIIENEQRGLLVEPDHASELAKAIQRMLQDTPLRERLAAAGHDFATRTYASGPLAERYAQIVRSVHPGPS